MASGCKSYDGSTSKMQSITLNNRELDAYRTALAIDESDNGPVIPKESYRCMCRVLKARGIAGEPETVTVHFAGHGNTYYLNYHEVKNDNR